MDKDMSFLREFFRIPEHVQTCWVIIHDEHHMRLGLEIVGRQKFIDIADACFCQVCPKMDPKPASHVKSKESERFFTSDGESLILAPNYVRKLYFRRVYSEELMATPLL